MLNTYEISLKLSKWTSKKDEIKKTNPIYFELKFKCNLEKKTEWLTLLLIYIYRSTQVLYEAFYTSESVCIGTEINEPESTEARAELTHLCREVAKDGVSLLAREVATNRIVGVSFNKLQVYMHANCSRT